jgi:hypothetical protein
MREESRPEDLIVLVLVVVLALDSRAVGSKTF